MAPSAHEHEQARATYDGSRAKLHVYLLIGQSNMAGRAPMTRADTGVIERCWLLTRDNRWAPARNPLNIYSTVGYGPDAQGLGPGYTFARAMAAHDQEVSIGLVVNARGATSIAQWKKGGTLYESAVKRAKMAGKTGTLKGILWHQGEWDLLEGNTHYLADLKALVLNLRRDLGVPDLPFVAGEIGRPYPLINDQLAKLPDTVPFTGLASAEGLELMDRWHFDAASVKRLGERYARQMLKLHARQTSGVRKRGP
jgi:hypothetical protein